MSKVRRTQQSTAKAGGTRRVAAWLAVAALFAAMLLPGWHGRQIEAEVGIAIGLTPRAGDAHEESCDCTGVCPEHPATHDDGSSPRRHDHRLCTACRLIELLPAGADLKAAGAEVWRPVDPAGEVKGPIWERILARRTGSVTARGPPPANFPA